MRIPLRKRNPRPAGGLYLAAAVLPLLHTTFYPPAEPANTVEVAVDRRGVPASDIQLLEDGKPSNRPESSVEFRATGHGVTAVLAIDASGSVRGRPFDSVKAALLDFVSASRPRDRVAILSFADSVDVRQPFTSDKAQLSKAIGALQAGGRATLLNQAISTGLNMLESENTNARRRLLVITDGRNEGPGPAQSALEKQSQTLQVPVDCIGITRLSPRFLLPMRALAAASGGAFVQVRGYEGLRGAMQEGIEGLLSTPVLTFRLARIRPDGASHSLQLLMAGSRTEPARVFLPRTGVPALLLLAAAFAVALFAAGLVLVIYSRRRKVPEVAVPPPPAPLRTPTVYAPPVPPPARPKLAPAVRPAAVKAPPPQFQPAPPQPSPSQPTEFRQIFPPPAPGHPALWLCSKANGARYGIEAAEVWIGAGEGNQIRLPGDSTVSRNHACIQWAAGDLYLFDNRSTNGTRVNGKPMEPGSRIRLQPGDRIEIGRSSFTMDQ